jgi:molecular chaperone GrpE
MARIGKTNVENAKLYSIKSFAEGMLEIADNLSRALESLPEEKRALPDVKVLFEGVAMTERVLQQVFTRYGIKKFNPLNEKFDPTRSAALFEIQDPTKAPGTVAYVQAPGYTLHDRLLRAAQVGVVAQPADDSPSSSDQA